MLGTIVITHGSAAKYLISTCEEIMGTSSDLAYFCVDWDDDVDQAKQRLKKEIEKINKGRGVLLLTDIFGGTPTNISLAFYKPSEIEIITGVNLPMIMKAMTLDENMSVKEAAVELKKQAKKSIYIASELL